MKQLEELMPWNKSEGMRAGFKALFDKLMGRRNNLDEVLRFLEEHHDELSDDMCALHRSVVAWLEGGPINVGESGTAYRLSRFLAWKLGEDREITTQGSLTRRKERMQEDPDMVNWPPERLLELDNETTQWATAAYVFGDRRKVPNPPHKLEVTYKVIDSIERGTPWTPRRDETIVRQAQAFMEFLYTGKMNFVALQPEDYFFAGVFGMLSEEDMERIERGELWPSLRGHESDRIEEMKEMTEALREGRKIRSHDHRAVQAAAMYYKNNGRLNGNIEYPSAVNKSWRRFWEFLEYAPFAYCP